MQYDAYGQVIAVYADAAHSKPIVKYAYNDKGYQVLKKHYNEQGQPEKDTWYVRDASGSVLSIYEEDMAAKQSLSPVEYPVYAQGRLGMLSTRGSDEVYQYELSDHVGNVRAVISRQRQADGSIDVLYTRDYYSFGSVIEDNERNKGTYRYGYQGQYSEEDEKTNWHSFELRQYDSDIGRWNSIDPYGQYASPYVAMGNAPNMMVDMDGGWSGAFTSPFIRYGAFAAGGAIVGGITAGLSGGNTKKGVAIGAAAGLLLAGGLSVDFSKVSLPSVSSTSIATATSIMSHAVQGVTRANRLPTNVVLPSSEIQTLPPNVDINFAAGIDGSQISDFSRGILRRIAIAARVNTINITSTQRNALQQATAMFNNTLRTGIEEQLNIYGPSGDAVINVFSNVWNGNNRDETINAMTNEIINVGPENVSRHAANPNVLNVMDISQRTIRNHGAFIRAAQNNGVRILNENNVFHLEITQP